MAIGAREARVERGQRQVDCFGYGDVPRVVARQYMAQLPHSLGNGGERVHLDVEIHQVAMRCRRFERSDLLGAFEAAR